jgi:DinB superfamily
MEKLTPQLADEYAGKLFGEGTQVDTVSRYYTREEMLAFLQENVAKIEAEVRGMSPEQLMYRVPGKPGGPDASGDEEHFDTSEIVTHLASAMTFHQWNITRALKHERPTMTKPPEGATTTGKRKDVVGSGGWRGMNGRELADLLKSTVERFVAYINSLSDADMVAGTSSFGFFNKNTPHDWLFLAIMHAGMHLNQIQQLKAQGDYPR